MRSSLTNSHSEFLERVVFRIPRTNWELISLFQVTLFNNRGFNYNLLDL